MTSDDNDNPGVIAFPPLILLVSAVISALVHFFLIRLPIMSYSASLVCGIVLVVLAPTLALSALVTMKTAGTNVNPAKPALTIVRGGPFRFTRNPMYLGHLIFLLGVAITFWSWFALVVLASRAYWFHQRVLRDEVRLERVFGAEYTAYRARVKRWIPDVF